MSKSKKVAAANSPSRSPKAQKSIDAYDIYHDARSYGFAAAQLLNIGVTGDGANCCIMPGLVFTAFFTELALKCLFLMRYGHNRWNTQHSLKQMFKDLPPNDKNLIERQFANKVSVSPIAQFFLKNSRLMSIDSVLDRSDVSFKTLRYRFECNGKWGTDSQGHSGLHGLDMFANVVIEVIDSIKPDWLPRFEKAQYNQPESGLPDPDHTIYVAVPG